MQLIEPFFLLWRLKTRWNPKEKKKKTRNEGFDYLGWGFTEAADPTTAAPATWRWWTNEQKGPGAPKMRWISAGRNEVYGNVPPHRHASQSERTCRVGGPVSLSLSDEKKDLITFFSMKKKKIRSMKRAGSTGPVIANDAKRIRLFYSSKPSLETWHKWNMKLKKNNSSEQATRINIETATPKWKGSSKTELNFVSFCLNRILRIPLSGGPLLSLIKFLLEP